MAAHSDWSRAEVALIVADYFDMLQAELFNRSFSKTEHRELLGPQLAGRSKGSIEFKHQNVSAVLVELGMPYIEGYKPLGNYQNVLAEVVDEYLDHHPGFMENLTRSPILSAVTQPNASAPVPDLILEDPPDEVIAPREHAKPWLTRRVQRVDFAARDAENRKLATLGEELVVGIEKQRLLSVGRDDLAGRVQWMSRTIGDGLGFDILSFDETDDSESLIEVKTTGLGKYFPFYVTGNELRCSEDMSRQFRLYRVFDFARRPRLYVLRGALSAACLLEPVQYQAFVRRGA